MDGLRPNYRHLTSRKGWLSLGFVAAVLPAVGAAAPQVLLEENFDSDAIAFSTEGRIWIRDGYARFRGGESAAITSDIIYTNGTQGLSLLWDRETSGLDAGEQLMVEVSVDGGAFQLLEGGRDLSGESLVRLPDADRFVQLRFRLEANSFLERGDIRTVVVTGESDTGCTTDCGGPDPDPDPGEPPVTAGATIIPDSTWTCGMAGGIPDPITGELVFRTRLPVNDILEVGQTPYGERTVLPVAGARLTDTSNGLQGSILPGSLDFDLTLPSGAREHESRYTIETRNGDLIYMRNCGVADGDTTRFVARFEAPQRSDYRWLHEGVYVGVREITPDGVALSVYRNPIARPDTGTVRVPSDNTVRQQSWECPSVAPGSRQGSQVLQARVGIGGFQSVGESRDGSRRIIPITGGSFSGNVSGSVNPGGADYQLTVGGDLTLEARYTLRTNDGELIVVRNCGDYGSGDLTLPLFEAPTASRYDWMNHTDFVGTITPGLRRVTITVFERR